MRRLMFLVGLFALFAAVAQAATASPGAVITRQTFSVSGPPESGLTDGCVPGATGTIAGTATFSFQSVETATGVHVSGTEVDTGRIDWSNGWYTIIGSTDRFSFTSAAQGTTVVNPDAHVDFGDFYDADGVFLFRETFRAAEQFVVTNGTVTRVEFEMGHFHVFGSDCTPG
jgi:hypothetical protein